MSFRDRIVEVKFVDVRDLEDHPKNWRTHDKTQLSALEGELSGVGNVSVLLVVPCPGDGTEGKYRLIDGHARKKLQKRGKIRVAVLDLTEEEQERVILGYDALGRMAGADQHILHALLDHVTLASSDLTDLLQGLLTPSLATGDGEERAGPETDAPVDKAAELAVEWGTAPGQVWEIASRTVPGRCHRVLCGDSTVGADVARLMGEISGVSLLHADPPYGMGKEADGIANDNLYREKLDAFQMAWWRTWRPFLADNASAYIWGNAADLWRLWYVGGLSASERMAVRNEIVWDKGSNLGMSSSELRSYSPAGGERSLFCVLGDQEFNNDADNYWEGWEPIRRYLCTQRDQVGWTNRDVAGFFGFHPRMADHWFSRSQWSMPRPEQYARLQQEAMGSAFLRNYDTIRHEYDTLKKEYDDLRRAFYETRAYFDNTHDNMTDVWSFPRVTGEDRHGHATPKPVAMVARAIKSSCPPGAIVAEPFLGSGTTLVAAEREGRVCVGCELSPGYVAVILQRLKDMGLSPRLVSVLSEHDEPSTF